MSDCDCRFWSCRQRRYELTRSGSPAGLQHLCNCWVTCRTHALSTVQAVEEKRKADDISAVLYPNDATEYGKELRLKQQYFFVSASIQVRPLSRSLCYTCRCKMYLAYSRTQHLTAGLL